MNGQCDDNRQDADRRAPMLAGTLPALVLGAMPVCDARRDFAGWRWRWHAATAASLHVFPVPEKHVKSWRWHQVASSGSSGGETL